MIIKFYSLPEGKFSDYSRKMQLRLNVWYIQVNLVKFFTFQQQHKVPQFFKILNIYPYSLQKFQQGNHSEKLIQSNPSSKPT